MQIVAPRFALPRLAVPQTRDKRPVLGAKAAAATRTGELAFATISTLDELERLESDWTALFETSGRPQQVFQTFAWLKLWSSLYTDEKTTPAIVTGRVGGRLALVWPLVLQTRMGLRVLSFMGEPLSQYGDALIDPVLDESALDAALTFLMSLPVDVVSLRRVRDDAVLAPPLARRLGPGMNRQAAPVIDLSETPDAKAFEARFPGKVRAGRRRRRRRLEERGAVTFTHYQPSPDAAALVATALDFKREWARQAGVLSPALRDPRFERFFTAAALPGRNAPGLRVSALRCGAEIVGVEISVVCKNRLFGHVLAPRPGLGQLGLGGILAEAVVLNALAQGYEAVDLLAPADPYKLDWTSQTIGVGDYVIARSRAGALYAQLWLRFGRDTIKAAKLRLEPCLAAVSRRWARQRDAA